MYEVARSFFVVKKNTHTVRKRAIARNSISDEARHSDKCNIGRLPVDLLHVVLGVKWVKVKKPEYGGGVEVCVTVCEQRLQSGNMCCAR